jgi:hypothetical protein
MFRTCETYRFDLVSEGDTGPVRIPCQVEITSRRDLPDVDHHDMLTIDDTTDARLSMVTRSVITSRIAEDLDGMPIDGPILDLGPTSHAPERIAVWAYWLAHDQSEYERKVTDWNLVVESTRVIVSDHWSIEYAPSAGDR